MLQIKPGEEFEVADNLVGNDTYALLGLGRYDLLLISEKPDFSAIFDFRIKPLEKIVDADVISGFKWIPNNASENKFEKNKAITGVCNIKFDLSSVKNKSVNFEQEMAKKIYEMPVRHEANVCVYGNLGFSSLVCIIETDTLHELSDFIHDIKQSVAHISEISTIPSINLSYLKDEKKLGDLHEKVKATILIGLSGFNLDIPKICSKNFGDKGRSIFGYHDYEIEFEGELRDLIKGLANSRKALADVVNLTRTIISHENETFSWSTPLAESSLKSTLKAKLERSPNEWKDELRDFLFFFNLYEMSMNDYTVQELFINQYRLFESLFELYEKAQIAKNNNDLNSYSENMRVFHFTLDCIRMGYLQRFSGIQLGNLLGGKSLNVAGFGLSLRMIKSAEAIPKSLLNQMNLNWAGFCLFSYYGIFFNQPFGILGYPSVTMPKIEGYWGGFHETGHDAYDQLEALDLLPKSIEKKRDKRVENLLENAIRRQGQEEGTFLFYNTGIDKQIDHMIQEIFADMFDFRFGFYEKWSRYVQTVWVYITENFPMSFEYVTRMLILYLIMGPGRKHKKSEIDDFINEGITDLQKATKRPIPESIVNYSKNLTKLLWEIAREIAKFLYSFSSNAISDKELLAIRDSFDQGISIANIEPAAVINALLIKPVADSNYATRFAALLSLYNWATSS